MSKSLWYCLDENMKSMSYWWPVWFRRTICFPFVIKSMCLLTNYRSSLTIYKYVPTISNQFDICMDNPGQLVILTIIYFISWNLFVSSYICEKFNCFKLSSYFLKPVVAIFVVKSFSSNYGKRRSMAASVLQWHFSCVH